MRNKTLLAVLMASTLLVGCTMSPRYERPASPITPQWPQGEAYDEMMEGDAVKVSEIAWKDFFQSPQLHYVIDTALAHNRDLQIAALNIEAARAAYRIQRADLVPNVDATGAMNRQRIPENASITGQAETTTVYTANVGVTAFELDLFGRVRSLNERALQEYFATAEARDATRIALIAEVANAYLAYQADKKLLDLTNNTLKAQEESYNVIKQSFEMGIGSQLDVSQAATLVETARANRAQYIRRVAQDKNALTLLMGATIDETILDTENLDAVKIMEELPVGLSSAVLLDRPDIRQQEHVLKAANANIGAARAAFFPRISLTGSAGLASDSLSDLFQSGSGLAWAFVPQVTMPIFEGGRNVANLDGATANQKIAIANYEKALQIAFREVSDELAARGTFTDQLNAQRALVAASQKAYDISNERYKRGVDSHLAVLDAQRQLYSAQQNEIMIQQQRLANLVTLYKVLGGGKQ